MKKGSKHSEEAKLKISQSMQQKWNSKNPNKSNAVSVEKRLDENKLKVLASIVSRASLAQYLGKQFGGARDLYKVLGYKSVISFNDYLAKYTRGGIAKRIVDAPSSATWRRPPIVYENNSKNPDTPFEKDWVALNKRLRVLHYFERVDRISGIGRFGILMIGIGGSRGRDLSKKLEGKLDDPNQITHLSVFSEGSVRIKELVDDRSDPDFGKPLLYEITLSPESYASVDYMNVTVHASRVIHVAEDLMEDEVYGTPRLQAVFNLLDDLDKTVPGSAEMFWQGAYRGLHVDVNPEFQLGELDNDSLAELDEEIEEYIHGIRRVIRTQGVDVKPIRSQIADPSGVFDAIITLISGTTKIPKRILFGSERGELASEQDEVNWNSRIKERQEQFAEPVILRPFVNKMIDLGVISPPDGVYDVHWPSLFEMDETRQAQAVWTWARAAEKLADAVSVGIITKEQAFEILNVPGLMGFSTIKEVDSKIDSGDNENEEEED